MKRRRREIRPGVDRREYGKMRKVGKDHFAARKWRCCASRKRQKMVSVQSPRHGHEMTLAIIRLGVAIEQQFQIAPPLARSQAQFASQRMDNGTSRVDVGIASLQFQFDERS